MIVVLPTATAVILPVLSTVATDALEEVHNNSLLVALSGKNVTDNASVISGFSVVAVLDSVIPARSTELSFLHPVKKAASKTAKEIKISFCFIIVYCF